MLTTAGWRRSLLLGVCDFPKGPLGAVGPPQSICRIACSKGLCPHQILAGRKSLWGIAEAKNRPSAPTRDAGTGQELEPSGRKLALVGGQGGAGPLLRPYGLPVARVLFPSAPCRMRCRHFVMLGGKLASPFPTRTKNKD